MHPHPSYKSGQEVAPGEDTYALAEAQNLQEGLFLPRQFSVGFAGPHSQYGLPAPPLLPKTQPASLQSKLKLSCEGLRPERQLGAALGTALQLEFSHWGYS